MPYIPTDPASGQSLGLCCGSVRHEIYRYAAALRSMHGVAGRASCSDVRKISRKPRLMDSGARNVNTNVTILLRKMDGTEVSCIQTSENYRGAYSYALGWACVQPYLCKVCRGNGNFQLVKFIETALQH